MKVGDLINLLLKEGICSEDIFLNRFSIKEWGEMSESEYLYLAQAPVYSYIYETETDDSPKYLITSLWS